MIEVMRGFLIAGLAGLFLTLCVGAAASLAPIIVKQGTTRVRAGSVASSRFVPGRAVECRTFGRLLTVHVPRRGETTVPFRTTGGTKVWLYLEHIGTATTIWCGAATRFGGH